MGPIHAPILAVLFRLESATLRKVLGMMAEWVTEVKRVAPRNSRLGESFVYGLRKAGRRRQSGMKIPARTTRMEARVVAGR
jgi:hypothetical protein